MTLLGGGGTDAQHRLHGFHNTQEAAHSVGAASCSDAHRAESATPRVHSSAEGRRAWRLVYRISHFFLELFAGAGGHKTTRIASSKTVLRPFCVNAEHSKYLVALICLAISSPSSKVIGV